MKASYKRVCIAKQKPIADVAQLSFDDNVADWNETTWGETPRDNLLKNPGEQTNSRDRIVMTDLLEL